jgi:putative endonuclease
MLKFSVKSFWLYILASRPRGTLCVGMTNDLVRRVYEHREGLVDGFTKQHGVKMLVYCEQQRKKHQALVAQMEDRSDPFTEPDWRDLWEEIAQ